MHTVAPSPEQDVTPPHERPAERAPAPLGADAPPREVWLVRVGCAVVIVLAALIVCGPMLPRRVPTHPWSDMSNHVREVHEFKLALREGQVPPIVAPEQNGQLRGPQFQYYSVTAYLLPGLFALVGVNSYRALGLGMFVQTVLGGYFFYRTGRALRLGRAASLLGATAFLLFPFVGIDLYRRGGHGFNAIVKEYGRDVLDAQGEIDRNKLADVAFKDATSAAKLNALIHPLVRDEDEP